MEQVKNYYKRFVKEGFDKNGILNKFEIDCPDNFNFGYDIIDKFGEIDPERKALIHIDLQENRHDFSYSQLSKLSTRAANLFASYGIKKGDTVMLVLKRNYQFWIAIIGLIKLGAIAIPATHLLTTHDFTYRFERASVKAIVCTGYNPDIAKYVDEAQEEIHADGLIKFIANGHKDGWVSFDDEVANMPETMERVQTDTREHMLLYFTSGTTGYPKMVIHNHRYALAHIQTAAHWQNVDPDGIHLTISDTGWGKAAWGKLFGQMSLGACVFVYDFDKFIPTDMLRIMQNYKITSFCAPPTMFRFFIKEGLENYDLSSLKYSAIAGEALNPEVYNKWLEFTGLKLMEAFGQTESTALLANLVGMTPKPGSMGKPTPLYDVIHNHRYALAHIQTAAHWQNVDPDGIHLTISDTGWGKAAWGKLFGQMSLGACVFVYDFDKFIPTDMLRIMQNYKITSFCAPPTMFRFFIKEGLENYDLSSLKYSAIAGEALNPEVYNKWLEFTGLKLMEAFGQTESTALLANLVGMTPKPGSMGKPTPLYDVDVVDDDGNPVPVGEVGEIVVRAERGKDGLFDGYYRDEELTDQAWHDGLYHTGDTAWKDEDGYFWYVGRNDDVIKASGYRIGPFEIESVLIAHPSVLECAVTGAPDPIRGQVVKATIVLARGYEPSEELKKELQNYVKKNTAPYKYPRIVEFVEELPKTISGKIRRVQIRNEDNKKNNL